MKKLNRTILLIAFVFQLSGCSYYLNTKSATEKRVDLIVSQAYKKYENRDVVFERVTMEFSNYQEAPVILTSESKKDSSRLSADGSQINTLFDGFGNKTETRNFFNDPLIKFVVVRTTPAGNRAAFVYAQNGDVKSVPHEYLEKIHTLSSSEIARSVQIVEGRRENELLAGLQKKQTPQPVESNSESELPPASPADPAVTPVTEGKQENENKTKSEKENFEKILQDK